MKVRYEEPIRNESGYVFSRERLMAEPIKVASREAYILRQERLVEASSKIHQYLAGFQLPTGVEGAADLYFRVWTARGGYFGNAFGQLGYPTCSIRTNFGNSSLTFSPGERSSDPLIRKGGLIVEVHCGGLAEKIVKDLKDSFDDTFKPQITRFDTSSIEMLTLR